MTSTDQGLWLAAQEEDENAATQDRNLRFSGVGRLYSSSSEVEDPSSSNTCPSHLAVLDRLTASTVVVVGLGGVGSWAAEALCRSGIGNLVLVDLDDICISNTNRQLHATSTSVGRMKLDEMKARLTDINPQCKITLVHDFVSEENVDEILDSVTHATAVLDTIDGAREKTALLAACVHRGIPIVTCGGAAGRMDPTKVAVADLTKVEDDRLLATCRKDLRKHYQFEGAFPNTLMKKRKTKVTPWDIQAVFSTERRNRVSQGSDTSSFRRCDGPLGTACFATGTFGFVAASVVVEMIANDKLIYPKAPQLMQP